MVQANVIFLLSFSVFVGLFVICFVWVFWYLFFLQLLFFLTFPFPMLSATLFSCTEIQRDMSRSVLFRLSDYGSCRRRCVYRTVKLALIHSRGVACVPYSGKFVATPIANVSPKFHVPNKRSQRHNYWVNCGQIHSLKIQHRVAGVWVFFYVTSARLGIT